MLARDIMTKSVVTVRPDTTVTEIAEMLLERRISAVPVTGPDGQIEGIVSEGDLIRRAESGTERHPSWWLSLFVNPQDRAFSYLKSHGGHASDVMTRKVATVSEDATLEEVADMLESRHIKRVPVVKDGRITGIVSRADLLRGLVARKASSSATKDDRELQKAIEKAVSETGARSEFVNVVVSGGIVHLWGAVESRTEKDAIRVAAEGVDGVKGVEDRLGVFPASVRTAMWAE